MLLFVRHGRSTGNVAKLAAWAADKAEGGKKHELAYQESLKFVDCPLAEQGLQEATAAKARTAAWQERPTLIVCSPLTRAIQTAAIVFEEDLARGTAELVIRPEVREYYPDNNENQGRRVAELRACPQLQALSRWKDVERALSDEATRTWREQWDTQWACGPGGAWQAHVGSISRVRAFMRWLEAQPGTTVAVVCHYGAINNLLNSEPWTVGLPRFGDPARFPCGGLAKRFDIANCGWVAVVASPYVQHASSE